MKRKFLVLGTLILGLWQTVPAYALEAVDKTTAESGIMPLYEHVRSISTVIAESNGNVSCGVAVTLQETGKIEITMKLQRYVDGSWKTIKTWTGSKTAAKFNYTESTTLSDTNDLRVYSTTKVTVGGISETITQTDEL